MSENVYKNNTGATVVICGGDALPGCPSSWKEANKWIEDVNKEKDKSEVPIWSWDCGYKLDFDGPLISVSSRFYPPKSHYGPTWDGDVYISVLGKHIIEKSFDCPTLDELKVAVEKFVFDFTNHVEQMMNPNPPEGARKDD